MVYLKRLDTQNNTIKLKRTLVSSLGYLGVMLPFIRPLSSLDFETLKFMDFVNISLLIGLLMIFLRVISRPYYMELGLHNIKIYRDLFYVTVVPKKDIERYEIAYSPFSSTYFLLKNGSKVKFNAYALSNKSMNILEEYIRKI